MFLLCNIPHIQIIIDEQIINNIATMCNRLSRFASAACQIAHNSPQNFKLGAIVTKGSKVILSGTNKHRTQFLNLKRPSLHAEMDVAQQLIKNLFHRDYVRNEKSLSQYIIWVVRIGKDANGNTILRDAHPCFDCLNLLSKCGFKRIGFSDENGIMRLEKIRELRESGHCHISAAQRYVGRVAGLSYVC